MLEIIIYSAIIGIIGGGCIAAGAARMFHAPEIQAMGAFRTLGELNACNGDPIAHFSFGLGFFFSSAASAVAAGALTQDVMHRIVPNWSAAALMVKNNKPEETLHNPRKMMCAGAVVGGVSALVSGNAVPGIVLGILIGKSAEENGYKNKIVQILIAIVVVMFLVIAYFRGFFGQF